jgi:hypothetical protein
MQPLQTRLGYSPSVHDPATHRSSDLIRDSILRSKITKTDNEIFRNNDGMHSRPIMAISGRICDAECLSICVPYSTGNNVYSGDEADGYL